MTQRCCKYILTIPIVANCWYIWGSFESNSAGERWSRTWVVSVKSGFTEINVIMAMNILAIGSALCHPKLSMSNVEIITPTDPRVSAGKGFQENCH